jgi:hypothetical protein
MRPHASIVVTAALVYHNSKLGCTVNGLKLFLERMGGLHDAVILQLMWSPMARNIRFDIKDLCCNFVGLPEYPGMVSGSIELHNISRVVFDVEANENRLSVYEFSVEIVSENEYRTSVLLCPAGKIIASYTRASFPEIILRET